MGQTDLARHVARAQVAFDAVHDDPRHALTAAGGLLDDDACPAEAQVVAFWAMGRAHYELNEIEPACLALSQGAALAASISDLQTEAHVRISLSISLAAKGSKPEAFAELEAAMRSLTGTELARAVMQRGLLELQDGDLERAVRSFDLALAHTGDDRVAEARLRVNRSTANMFLGRLRAAELDLIVAQRLSSELGQQLMAAAAEQNLGFLAGRRGDVPTALQWCDRARRSYEKLRDPGRLVAVLDGDQCELFLAAGLASEAVEAATRAVDAHTRDGNEADLAQAELLLATAWLSRGGFPEAREAAERSTRRFAATDRRAWAALAGYVGIQARVHGHEEGELGSEMLDDTVVLAAELDAMGWRNEALHVRSFAARIALELGDRVRARHELEVSTPARHRGPAGQRVQAWHATALLRHLEGNDAGARRALHAGLRLVDDARRAVGSSELRAAASHHGTDITQLGLELARDRPRQLLAWLERSRSLALLLPPVRPPDDEVFANELTALRQARADLREGIAAGHPPDDLQQEVIRLERSVRDQARQARGSAASPTRSTTTADLRSLGGDVLVEYLAMPGGMTALVGRGNRVSQHDLGSASDVAGDLDSIGFVLHRLARRQGSDASRLLAARTLDEVGSRLGRTVLDPVAHRLGSRPVVVVPDGPLERAPWRALPALRHRPFTVNPSLRVHADAVGRSRSWGPRPRALLVAGPGLPGAEDEIAQLRELHPDAEVLTGADATTGAVCAGLARCDLAHLACHGRLRIDNPLFSSLTMADGELTVYDLERCACVPTTVVLSACSTGLGSAPSPREVLGLSTALLSLGCATVIAPVAPVSDVATTQVMVALHASLRRGERPSVALLTAVDPEGPVAAWASWIAFACFGAG